MIRIIAIFILGSLLLGLVVYLVGERPKKLSQWLMFLLMGGFILYLLLGWL